MASDARPLRIAVLTSAAAPGLETLLSDVSRGTVYQIGAVIGSEPVLAEARAIEQAGVPLILLPIPPGGDLSPHSLPARRHFDTEASETLQRLNIDYVFLCGYRYIVTEPLLDAFPGRIIAMHDADLTLTEDDGQRKYKGAHAVTDALMSGEPETRPSAYVVTARAGEGPLLLLGRRYAVPELAKDARRHGAADMLCRYADLHREWMVRDSWGAMLLRIVELLAAGTVHVVGDLVWIDGAPAPCLMGEAPNVCHEHASAVTSGIPRSCPFIKS